MLRRAGRAEVLRKHTVPDLVFFFFMNKYGQRKVAHKYVGSLVNSLMLHRTQDLRLGELRVPFQQLQCPRLSQLVCRLLNQLQLCG